MAVKVNVAVMTMALPVACTMRIMMAREMNDQPGVKNSRNLSKGREKRKEIRRLLKFAKWLFVFSSLPRQEAADAAGEHSKNQRKSHSCRTELEKRRKKEKNVGKKGKRSESVKRISARTTTA